MSRAPPTTGSLLPQVQEDQDETHIVTQPLFGFYQKQNRSGIILSARVIRPERKAEAALHTYVVAQHNMETFTQERQF